jgi:thermostable 8-oxoguanine DNA glycosylase
VNGEAEECIPENNSRSMLDRTEDDWKKTYKAAEESGLSDQEQIFQFIEYSIATANQIVVQQWKAIDALAQKLLKIRHLDKESVLEIITPLIATNT